MQDKDDELNSEIREAVNAIVVPKNPEVEENVVESIVLVNMEVESGHNAVEVIEVPKRDEAEECDNLIELVDMGGESRRIAMNAMKVIEVPEQNKAEGGESDGLNALMDIGGESGQAKSQDFVSQFETEQTKGLSNEELQRIVFLQQLKVLELQKKKLELEMNTNSNSILFDISGLNVSNIWNANLWFET